MIRPLAWGVLVLALAHTAPAQSPEVLVYTHGDGAASLELFTRHADVIDVIAPQAYRISERGDLTGAVSPDLLAVARERGVRVMPLFVNPGFDQALVHGLLSDREARARAVQHLVSEGRAHGYWGWQFDLENIHVSMRDSLTAFYAEAADALHAHGMVLSIAVVPTDGSEGQSDFARYMQDNWRNSYDVAALDSLGDFVSWMTYAQHGGVTAPGPIAGLPWMRRMVGYLEEQRVDLGRVSLGIPFYSGWWAPGYRATPGGGTGDARVVGREISHARARELIDRGGASPVWDEREGVHIAWWEDEGTFQWVFLEDALSMRAKLGYAASLDGLRGVSIWVLGAEDPAVWEVLREAKGR